MKEEAAAKYTLDEQRLMAKVERLEMSLTAAQETAERWKEHARREVEKRKEVETQLSAREPLDDAAPCAGDTLQGSLESIELALRQAGRPVLPAPGPSAEPFEVGLMVTNTEVLEIVGAIESRIIDMARWGDGTGRHQELSIHRLQRIRSRLEAAYARRGKVAV